MDSATRPRSAALREGLPRFPSKTVLAPTAPALKESARAQAIISASFAAAALTTLGFFAILPRLILSYPRYKADQLRIGSAWDLNVVYDHTKDDIVIGNEVFISNRDEIQVLDLATGAKLRSAKVVHTVLVAAGDALVAANAQESFGLDKLTLGPTWRAPTPKHRHAVGEYLLETPRFTQPKQLLRLRRASDGVVMWENEERLSKVGHVWATPPQLDGDTLYVQAYVGVEEAWVVAIDVVSGVVRWRAEGNLRTASGGRVVIQDVSTSSISSRILDAATGHVRWHAAGAWVSLHGDIAYAGTSGGNLTAIDLSTNRVLWRRTGVSDAGGDDKWLYGITSSRELKILDRTTGEIVGELQIGERFTRTRFRGPLVVRVGDWLFAAGPLSAPEQRKPVVVRGCLIVMGCGSNSYAPKGAKVTIDDTTVATTDRRGCFKARATLGLGPVRVEVASGTKEPLELDTDFPEVVIFSGPPVTLQASYLGVGCAYSEPGGFP